ncbi:hypothetical protein CEXT_62011 [Caerostris extrusa]|uniref:Uncharacterized protein n=1 Tax=Caerostris extrusa TaxID=172846 RepID=A0AAV4RAH5_CAEEX|nr:hypothetical protein CEXT_62011 [Caerostris extrusa]
MVLCEICDPCRAVATHQSNRVAVIILENIPFPGENKVSQSEKQNLSASDLPSVCHIDWNVECGRNARIPFSCFLRRLQLS